MSVPTGVKEYIYIHTQNNLSPGNESECSFNRASFFDFLDTAVSQAMSTMPLDNVEIVYENLRLSLFC